MLRFDKRIRPSTPSPNEGGVFSRHKRQTLQHDWTALPLRTLTKHIVETHHAYLKTELPALDKSIRRIAQLRLGGSISSDLHRAIQNLRGDWELQMQKEETILFPAILELEATVAAGLRPPYSQFGSVANLAHVAAKDHDKLAGTLYQIQLLTNNCTCLKDCQPGISADFERLAILAMDISCHIHLEKDILFPRAIDLEK